MLPFESLYARYLLSTIEAALKRPRNYHIYVFVFNMISRAVLILPAKSYVELIAINHNILSL